MQHKKRVYTIASMVFLTLSMVLAVIPLASAAGAITLTPPTQVPGSSVTVDGTGFGATKTVGIGIGAEVNVTGEARVVSNVAIGPDDEGVYGPFTNRTLHYPIKPGSFSFHCVVTSETNVVESDYIDNGDGTLVSDSIYAVKPFVNYVTGEFGRSSNTDWSAFTVEYIASYTYYTYNVTPAAGVTTLASGAFSASITVPAVADGNYVVTAVDSVGNKATATLNVVPEGLTIGVMVLLSSVSALVGFRYFRKRSRTESSILEKRQR